MSIAQQIATPTTTPRTRPPGAPLRRAPIPRPGYALFRIVGLITLTALGAALMAGTLAIALVTCAANMGG